MRYPPQRRSVMVLTEREQMLLDLLIAADRTLFACALAVQEETTDSPDQTIPHLQTLPDVMIREHTLAALITLYQAGFIHLLRGTLTVHPDGTITTGRKQVVPHAEALRLLLAVHTWHYAYAVRTLIALVLAPTRDGMRAGTKKSRL